jgi:hypothetical protein
MAQEVEYRVHVLQDAVRLFRGCDENDLPGSMRSNYEQGIQRNPSELRSTVLHMAVSMFDNVDTLRALIARFPYIGTAIAVVELQPGSGVCRANTGSVGHWSVWGRPDELAGFVVDLVGI